MKPWFLFPTLSAPMPLQMALDEILFRRMESGDAEFSSRPLLRLYYSSEPWMTVGYSYKEQYGVPSTECEVQSPKNQERKFLNFKLGTLNSKLKTQIPVCRRITGGGRVLHGRDVLFSVAARKSHHEAFESVRISYLKIHEAVKAAYETLGFQPRFYRCDEKLARGQDCFLFPIATDLGLSGEKIAGGAQKRSSGALLHQESVKMAPGVEAESLMRGLQSGFEKMFEMKFQLSNLDPDLLEQAEQLAAEKYPAAGPATQSLNFSGREARPEAVCERT